jgi:hypothetical protein
MPSDVEDEHIVAPTLTELMARPMDQMPMQRPAAAPTRDGKKPMKRPAAAMKRPATSMQRPAAAAAVHSEGPMNMQEMLDGITGCPTMPRWLCECIDKSPSAPEDKTTHDDVIEMFTNPRLVPLARAQGLKAIRSMDRDNGWDLTKDDVIKTAFAEIKLRSPRVLMLSPPCTKFSKLMDCNFNRMNKDKVA